MLFKMLEKCGMREELAFCPLPTQGSNRGYDSIQLFYGLLVGVWCGVSYFFEHLEIFPRRLLEGIACYTFLHKETHEQKNPLLGKVSLNKKSLQRRPGNNE